MVPWHYSIRLVDPPEAPIEDRVVHNIRPNGSFTVQQDYKFNLNITWDPPAYPYKIVTSYFVWLLEEDRFIDFFLVEVSFFLFWVYYHHTLIHINLWRNYKAGLDQASSFELLEELLSRCKALHRITFNRRRTGWSHWRLKSAVLPAEIWTYWNHLLI